MAKKTYNTCLTCLDYYACEKVGLKPSIGECSIKRPDKRHIALKEIADILRKKGTAFLRHPVEVIEDYCGCDFPFTVRRISLPTGVNPEGLDFHLGTDSYGDAVWTKNLSTHDIVRILNEI